MKICFTKNINPLPTLQPKITEEQIAMLKSKGYTVTYPKDPNDKSKNAFGAHPALKSANTELEAWVAALAHYNANDGTACKSD
jgi:hypothetical protein